MQPRMVMGLRVLDSEQEQKSGSKCCENRQGGTQFSECEVEVILDRLLLDIEFGRYFIVAQLLQPAQYKDFTALLRHF